MGDDEHNIHKISTAKMQLLEDILEDLLDAGKKVVIFVRFIPELAAIESLLNKKKVGCVRISGDVRQEDRGEMVRRFQEDEDCRVFIAQIQTAGLGITLTAADTAIYYSLSYSFADYDQSRSRIHRIGQKNACTYIHLWQVAPSMNRSLKALAEKRSIAATVVDNWRTLIR